MLLPPPMNACGGISFYYFRGGKKVDKLQLDNIWEYYLVLENDLLATTRYVEPNQLETFSFEYQKIIVLGCCEVEAVFKLLCPEMEKDKKNKNVNDYREVVLGKFPKICECEVSISRAKLTIKPFEDWQNTSLSWWQAYQKVKHNRTNHFTHANLKNALYTLSALQILIYYLGSCNNLYFENWRTVLISSDYSWQNMVVAPSKKLPDFQ